MGSNRSITYITDIFEKRIENFQNLDTLVWIEMSCIKMHATIVIFSSPIRSFKFFTILGVYALPNRARAPFNPARGFPPPKS